MRIGVLIDTVGWLGDERSFSAENRLYRGQGLGW